MNELRQYTEQNNLTIPQVILAGEMVIPGRSEEEVCAFIDKVYSRNGGDREVCVRRRQGVVTVGDCQQRNRIQAEGGIGRNHNGDGSNGEGHEQQVQGDE